MWIGPAYKSFVLPLGVADNGRRLSRPVRDFLFDRLTRSHRFIPFSDRLGRG